MKSCYGEHFYNKAIPLLKAQWVYDSRDYKWFYDYSGTSFLDFDGRWNFYESYCEEKGIDDSKGGFFGIRLFL